VENGLLALCGVCGGNKMTELREPRNDVGGAQVLFLLFSFYLDNCVLAPLVMSFNDFLVPFSSSI
jgi:hypothetical protein